jgi:hypothetical protein
MTRYESTGGKWPEPGAVLSDCGTYRYSLTRLLPNLFAKQGKHVVFVMLNPSTADASHDDPTIRRCKGFAGREWATLMSVVNLFGYRATRPGELYLADDPFGPYAIGGLDA